MQVVNAKSQDCILYRMGMQWSPSSDDKKSHVSRLPFHIRLLLQPVLISFNYSEYLNIIKPGYKFLVDIDDAEKLHLCFLAAECYGIHLLPLKTAYIIELFPEHSWNKAAPSVFVALTLNSCSRV